MSLAETNFGRELSRWLSGNVAFTCCVSRAWVQVTVQESPRERKLAASGTLPGKSHGQRPQEIPDSKSQGSQGSASDPGRYAMFGNTGSQGLVLGFGVPSLIASDLWRT